MAHIDITYHRPEAGTEASSTDQSIKFFQGTKEQQQRCRAYSALIRQHSAACRRSEGCTSHMNPIMIEEMNANTPTTVAKVASSVGWVCNAEKCVQANKSENIG